MKCRIDIAGRKIWVDNDNLNETRPSEPITINLLRDGVIYKTTQVDPAGDGQYQFPCLIVWNGDQKYQYTIDEPDVPEGYIKTIQGYNVINTLNSVTINGTKIWDDNYNEAEKRPDTITVNLLQNGSVIRSANVDSPPDLEDTAPFSFTDLPFADSQGNPYVYTVDENPVQDYQKEIFGYTITNILIRGSFSFLKTDASTGLPLQGAVIELSQNGTQVQTSTSDASGIVTFSNILPGTYQMVETQAPAGFINNPAVYEVVVANDGTVTIDGLTPGSFQLENTPEVTDIVLNRATATVPAYMSAPNTWPLHGTTEPDLYMLDKVLITLPQTSTPSLVRWAYGRQTADYFRAGGGNDITTTYMNGFEALENNDYTVYVLYDDGTESIASITVDRLRNGTVQMPYLLIDFQTADSLEPSIPGINQFTLSYMQGGGSKLAQHYEIYENIDISGRAWVPLGLLSEIYPRPVIEAFTGSLYGNGNDILNMTFDGTVSGAIGMFQAVGGGAVIENLGLINYSAVGTSTYTAGFIAKVSIADGETASLKDLRLDGSVSGSAYAAGLICFVEISGSISIDNCSVRADIVTHECGAGIASYCSLSDSGSITVSNCHAAGSVTLIESSQYHASGIIALCVSPVGSNTAISIINCTNSMNLSGIQNVGGMVGSTRTNLTISSCYNEGNITTQNYGGGIAGDITSASATITNCYNTGSISSGSGFSLLRSGGLVGALATGTMENCYNIGNISSTDGYIGGIAGFTQNIQNCAAVCETVSNRISSTARIAPTYAGAQYSLSNNLAFDNMRVLISNVQKSPLDTGSTGTDGISVSATMIKTQELYENTLGWDFASVWSFGNGEYTLPILRNIPLNLQPTVLPSHL